MSTKDYRSGLNPPRKQQHLFPARQKSFKIRLSDDEYARLKAAARNRGLNASQLMRMALVWYTNEDIFSEEVMFDVSRTPERVDAQQYVCDTDVLNLTNELKRLRIEHVRQGVNLNQMARLLNKRMKVGLVDDTLLKETRSAVQSAIVGNDAMLGRVDELLLQSPDVMKRVDV